MRMNITSEGMIIVFFVYGLAFFILGLVSFLLSDRHNQYKIGKFFWLLALFGLLHGLNEWVDMLLLLGRDSWGSTTINSILYFRSFLLVTSFVFLLIFGIESLITNYRSKLAFLRKVIYLPYILLIVIMVIIICSKRCCANLTTIDILARYLIGFPGALLCSATFFRWMRHPQIKLLQSKVIKAGFIGMGVAFFCYSILAGIIVPQAEFWPASIFNYTSFMANIGLPVQLFRTLCALAMAVAVFGVLKIFNITSIMKLQEKAETDPMTHLYNYHALKKILFVECETVKRYNHFLSVLFIDIDDFKQHNDIYGHAEGDVVIKKLSNLLVRCSRAGDKVFRYGGEEFVILLPRASAKRAVKFAERIRKAFQTVKFNPYGNKKFIHKTISIGIAQYQTNMNQMEVVNLADKAMYKSKQKGKNRTCIYQNKKYIFC
jgi:diguanylate cyclase (GGDEF)-like protein